MAITLEVRERVGKLLGMLGSNQEGERANALAAIEQALNKSGETWASIGSLVAHGDLPGGDREQLLGRLISDRLRDGLAHAWAMTDGDAQTVRETAERCKASIANVPAGDLSRAIKIADDAKRRAGARQ